MVYKSIDEAEKKIDEGNHLFLDFSLRSRFQGGGGTLNFSSYVGSDPASTVYPPKISGISDIHQKIFEILADPERYYHFVP